MGAFVHMQVHLRRQAARAILVSRSKHGPHVVCNVRRVSQRALRKKTEREDDARAVYTPEPQDLTFSKEEVRMLYRASSHLHLFNTLSVRNFVVAWNRLEHLQLAHIVFWPWHSCNYRDSGAEFRAALCEDRCDAQSTCR